MLPINSEKRDKVQDTESSPKTWLSRAASSWTGRVFLCLLFAVPAVLKHLDDSEELRAAAEARVEARDERERDQVRREEAAKQVIAQRWWVIEFYNENDFKRGDFPQQGYYTKDGELWTPEVGGTCYDRNRHEVTFKRRTIDLSMFSPK